MRNHNPTHYIDSHGETAKSKLTPTQKRLTDSEIASIVEEYQGGITTYALAEKYDCNRKTISNHLKRHNVIVSIEKIKSEQSVKELIKSYKSGLTAEEVAEQFGISDTTVNKLLHKNDVEMRTRWDY